MIKANELRVGVNVIEKTITYSGLKENIITVRLKDIMNNDNLYPVPLSEEILIKCGFEERGQIYALEINGFCIEIEFIEGVFAGLYLDRIGTSLEFFHQLQNLYFSLTGQELTYLT